MHTKQNQPVVEPRSIDLRGHTMGSHTWINTLRFWRKKKNKVYYGCTCNLSKRASCRPGLNFLYGNMDIGGRRRASGRLYVVLCGGFEKCLVCGESLVGRLTGVCLKLYFVMFLFDENEVLCSWEESRWSLGKGNIIFCLFEIIAFVIEGWLLKWFWFFFVWGMNDAIYIVFLRWLLMDPMLFFYYEF